MGRAKGGTDKNDKKEVIKGFFVCTRDEMM
jgi:hypothetical protein